MRYIEIGQDIVDAIKGGANGNDQSETEEIVANISGFGTYFAQLIEMIMDFFWKVYGAIKDR